jgi:hypothetical protein
VKALRTVTFAAVLLLAAAVTSAGGTRSVAQTKKPMLIPVAHGALLLGAIDVHRHETWRWQRLMGKPRTPTRYTERRVPKLNYRLWVLKLWRKRAVRARRLAFRPPHRSAWFCIHRHEGAWNDPNPPYYGGLQMDLGFQRAYGPELLRRKGTADRWTPLEQMWVAERAYRSGRGFTPWPNTARLCGVL